MRKCVTLAPVKIAKLINLYISQIDSIRITDLESSLFAGRDIRMHLFDDFSVAAPLQGIVVGIRNVVPGIQLYVNLVPIFQDAATVKKH